MKYTKILYLIFLFSAPGFHLFSQVGNPLSRGPVPTENQWRWQQMEYYAFVHFSLNTYTDQSWGYGNEDVRLFNPQNLDCRQWACLCKKAGMKGLILTAKHHCGFCLWPSRYTAYSVKNAPWKNGHGDLVREMADACKEFGLKLGIYLSPWDRNHSDYGKPAYIQYFRNQLTELLTNYGPIFEIWFDGANGGSGYYGGANETRKIDSKTYYDWKNTYKLVRRLQPEIVIWNDGGDRGDLRWAGTEAGYIGETNWSLLDSTGNVSDNMLRYGLEDGNTWVPGEVNTSIRPEWFYHKNEDAQVKSLPQLMEIYYNSIGRNASLLLNFPIMPNGQIHPYDEQAVLAFAAAKKKAFAINLIKGSTATATNVRRKDRRYGADKAIDQSKETYWTTDNHIQTGSLTIHFHHSVSFNRLLVQEYVRLGQQVKSFSVDAIVHGAWKQIATATTIGYKRILRFRTVSTTKMRLNITGAKNCPMISNIEVYNAPVILAPPTLIREQSGDIVIIPVDNESQIYYTLDGSLPDAKSFRYAEPIKTDGSKSFVRCIAYDPISKKYSSPTEENFDIARNGWKVIGTDDKNSNKLFDGNPNTEWYPDNKSKMPVDLVIDLGKLEDINGFKYLPDQHWWASGIISNYIFYVSADGNEWKQTDAGEFPNIKNNRLWQIKTFHSVKARYVKLRALRNTQDDDKTGYAEFGITTP
jgi:alpha-L-fucosidase